MAVDPAVLAESLVLVKAQAAAREQLSDATQRSVALAVRAMLAGDWFDSTAITRLAKHLAATTKAGQRQTATSTAAYWARAVSVLTGRRVQPVRLVSPDAARTVPLDVVYGRLADQYRWLWASRGPDTTPEDRLRAAIEAHQRRVDRDAATLDRPGAGVVPDGAGVTPNLPGAPSARVAPPQPPPLPTVAPPRLTEAEIVDRVVDRAMRVADTSLTLTMRDQIEAAAKRDPGLITGYRRIIHPELGGKVCGLCVAASTRVYYKGNLLPIHGYCKCTVLAMIGDVGGDGDVGGAINDADLDALYQQAGGVTDGQALRRTRFRVVEHGERGFELVRGGDSVVFLTSQGA